jgi:hypothetical protein
MQAVHRQLTPKTLTLSARFSSIQPKSQAKPAKPEKMLYARMHAQLLKYAFVTASGINLGVVLMHLLQRQVHNALKLFGIRIEINL